MMLDITPYFEQEGGGVVGLKDETSKIINELAGRSKCLNAISIVGMAGIGKTALAREVYNDSVVARHFYYRAWISISAVYRVMDFLLGILTSPHIPPTRGDINSMSEENLGKTLCRLLRGCRYLIVIDDIWSIKAWHYLRDFLPDENNGSRILLTTRIPEVVWHINSVYTHHLGFLSKEESWDLLKAKVFGNESCIPPGLMKVGKRIAAKCEGLPSTIAAVARLLGEKEENEKLMSTGNKSRKV